MTNVAHPLLVPETGRIAGLLAEIMTPAVPQQELANQAPSYHVNDSISRLLPVPRIVPLPIGVHSVAEFFALINWRNRPDEEKPLPTTFSAPAAGGEHTVEAVLNQFGWE